MRHGRSDFVVSYFTPSGIYSRLFRSTAHGRSDLVYMHRIILCSSVQSEQVERVYGLGCEMGFEFEIEFCGNWNFVGNILVVRVGNRWGRGGRARDVAGRHHFHLV